MNVGGRADRRGGRAAAACGVPAQLASRELEEQRIGRA